MSNHLSFVKCINKKIKNVWRNPDDLFLLKRKLILIMTAFMLGMSNGMDMEDQTMNGNQIHTEQQNKKD